MFAVANAVVFTTSFAATTSASASYAAVYQPLNVCPTLERSAAMSVS